MWIVVAIAIVGPFVLSLVSTALVSRWSRNRGFVDLPGGHKQHVAEVALGGGMAITLAVVLPLVLGTAAAYWLKAGEADADSMQAGILARLPQLVHTHLDGVAEKAPMLGSILTGAIVLHVLGLIDDRKPLGAPVKFVVQFAMAAFVVIVCDVRMLEMLPGAASITLSILWIVVITNAFNFLDNMDGLSAGVAAITAAFFATSAMMAGQIFVPVLAWVLVGALLGFLGFNFAPARIYMGDAGSLVIGYLLGVLTILTTFYDPALGTEPYGVFVPLAVLAVPLYDVVSVCTLRIRVGESPFRGDTRHFSHRLVRRGMSVRVAVLTIYLATATTGLSALILPRAEDWTTAMLVFAQCVCVVAMIALLEMGPSLQRKP